jgi:hypothetical protein
MSKQERIRTARGVFVRIRLLREVITQDVRLCGQFCAATMLLSDAIVTHEEVG